MQNFRIRCSEKHSFKNIIGCKYCKRLREANMEWIAVQYTEQHPKIRSITRIERFRIVWRMVREWHKASTKKS